MDKEAKALTEPPAPGTEGAVATARRDDLVAPAAEAAPSGEATAGAEAQTDGVAEAAADTEAEVPVEEDEACAAQGAPAAAADETAARLAALEAEKADLERRVAELRDRLLRSAADFDNFRKRTARQEQETKERARVEALRTFLPVIDNVERALGFAREMAGGERVAEGLQMVVRGFFDAFAGDGLARIEALGRPFDPTHHEAVGQVETAETPAGCVAQELQAGYRLGERLLRPALVVVAKPPAATAVTAAAEAAATEAAVSGASDGAGPAEEGPAGES